MNHALTGCEDQKRHRRIVVINADDLGISREVNQAITDAHRHGILTSASLMANGPAFDHALETVIGPHPHLGIGVHLCLTSGRSVSSPSRIPDLVDGNGRFRHTFSSLLRAVAFRQRALIHQIEIELTAQLETILGQGISIDHLDSHRYIHMIPAIFNIVLKLAQQHGKTWVRKPLESVMPLVCWLSMRNTIHRLRNVPKQALLAYFSLTSPGIQEIPHAEFYHGILDSGSMTSSVLPSLCRAARHGVTEIVTHPAYPVSSHHQLHSQADSKFLAAEHRQAEFHALIELKQVKLNGCCPVVFSRFSDIPPRHNLARSGVHDPQPCIEDTRVTNPSILAE